MKEKTKPAELKGIVFEALDLPKEKRAAFLQHALGDQSEELEQAQELLANADSADDFMGKAVVSLAQTLVLQRIVKGEKIGRYKLMEKIGEGGMGVVYVAEQVEPVKRKVALKVIKPGMDSKQVIARFEAEQQALALMEHPNIAKVLDAGTTEHGLPYFVMELVRGLTITEYCDQAKLPTRDRLALFVSVCSAIQHAHQKGIIHRDIKPNNVLVTLHDGKPVVKVIDFGVAKALHQQLSTSTIYTGLNQVIGTPLYMSPEQIELSGLDVDTRTDVYSLGVLLYELLTGLTPFDRERLLKSGFDEMRRIIREEEPPRPSFLISTLDKAKLSTSSMRRGVSERAFAISIRGELDWIALKALEKDRNRRYESASAFGADVQRYLIGEPVQACPPTFLYLTRKLVRRNQRAFIAASGMLVMLVIGLAIAYTQFRRAIVAEAESRNSLTLATNKATVAEKRLQIAEKAIDDMYTQFASNWISQQSGLSQVQREFLEKAVIAYESLARTEHSDSLPSVGSLRALLQLGFIRSSLGEVDEAQKSKQKLISQATLVLDRFPENTSVRILMARACSSLAAGSRDTSQHQEKVRLADLAIDHLSSIEGKAITDVTDRMELIKCFASVAGVLASEESRKQEAALAADQSVMEASNLAGDFPTFENRLQLAESYSAQGTQRLWWGKQNEECAQSYEHCLDLLNQLDAESPGTQKVLSKMYTPLNNLAVVYGRLKRDEQVYPLRVMQVEKLEALCTRFPEFVDYQDKRANSISVLANLERKRGNIVKADSLSQRAAELLIGLVDCFPDRRGPLKSLVLSQRSEVTRAMKERDFEKAIEQLEQASTRLIAYLSTNPEELEFYTLAFQVHRDLAVSYLCLNPSDAARAAEVTNKLLANHELHIKADHKETGDRTSPDDYGWIALSYIVSAKLFNACADEATRTANSLDSQSTEVNGKKAFECREKIERTVNEWVTVAKGQPKLVQQLMAKADGRDAHLQHRHGPSLDHLFNISSVESRRVLFAGFVDHCCESQSSPEELSGLAILLSSSKDYTAEAQKLLLFCQRQAVAKPDDVQAQQALAWVLFRCSRWQECLDLLRNPLQSSRFENGYIGSMALWHLGRKTEAMRVLSKTKEWMTKNEPLLSEQQKAMTTKPQPNVATLLRLEWEAEQLIQE